MRTIITAAAAVAVLTISPALAGGYMKIPDIAGESTRADHKNEIDIENLSYAIAAPGTAALGSGRRRASSVPGDFVVTKRIDAASPYIALAAFQQKSFHEIVIEMTRSGSGGAEFQYYTVTLSNARITSVDTSISESGESAELVGFAYEEIKINYTAQKSNGAAGEEHDIEYDVAAGV